MMAGGLGVISACIIKLPLAWIAPNLVQLPDTVPAQYGGTIWEGHITGLPGFGPVEIRTSPKAVITGKPFVNFQTQSPTFIASGYAKPGQISDVKISGDLTQFAYMDSRFSGLRGRFNLDIPRAEIGAGCISADGTINTDVLAQNAQTWQWSGPVLSGPITCENGAFVANLTGSDGNQSISADLRMSPDGSYRTTINLLTRDSRADAVLPLYGFTKNGRGFSLTETGMWNR